MPDGQCDTASCHSSDTPIELNGHSRLTETVLGDPKRLMRLSKAGNGSVRSNLPEDCSRPHTERQPSSRRLGQKAFHGLSLSGV